MAMSNCEARNLCRSSSEYPTTISGVTAGSSCLMARYSGTATMGATDFRMPMDTEPWACPAFSRTAARADSSCFTMAEARA